MRCLVCKKKFESATCPRCNTPILGVAEGIEDVEKYLAPIVDEQRQYFVKKVKLALVGYYWQERDGVIALERKETLRFCADGELMPGEYWLEQKFACNPEETELAVGLHIEYPDGTREETVTLSNLPEASLQEVGIRLEENHQLRLLLRNGVGGKAESAPIPLLA